MFISRTRTDTSGKKRTGQFHFPAEKFNSNAPKQQIISRDNFEKNVDTQNPSYWGPFQWFTFHNNALHYIENADDRTATRMANYIRGISVTLPCGECANHCEEYISGFTDRDLFAICKTQKGLFEFFVTFHNKVNSRLGKPQVSLEEAYRIYSKKIVF
jgi:hypothetical protein